MTTFLAPRDVAKRLGLSTSRVVQLDHEGKLPALRDSSGRRLYDPGAVERYARERERQARSVDAKPKVRTVPGTTYNARNAMGPARGAEHRDPVESRDDRAGQ
jgi:hypothetical protein